MKSGFCDDVADCRWAVETCIDHRCAPIVNCSSDAGCAQSWHECKSYGRCAPKAGFCDSSADCSASGEYCNDADHRCALYSGHCRTNSDCDTSWQQCSAGTCAPQQGRCNYSSDCNLGYFDGPYSCDSDAHICRLTPGRCLDDSLCPAYQQCNLGYCIRREGFCDETGACPAVVQQCNLTTHKCDPVGPSCESNLGCTSDKKCFFRVCVQKDGWCDRDDDCMGWQSCDRGSLRCILKTGFCQDDSDCPDGSCTAHHCLIQNSSGTNLTPSNLTPQTPASNASLGSLSGRVYFDDLQFDRFSEPGQVRYLLVRRSLPQVPYHLRYGNDDYFGSTGEDGRYEIVFDPPLPIVPGQMANFSIKLEEANGEFYVGYGTFRHPFGGSDFYGGDPVQFWSAFELPSDSVSSIRDFDTFQVTNETDVNFYKGYAETLARIHKLIDWSVGESTTYHFDQKDLPYVQFSKIYANTYQAMRYTRDVLKQPLLPRSEPVLITPKADDVLHTCEFGVAIGLAHAGIDEQDAPMNREWHEYGHGVMCGGFVEYPYQRSEIHHGGLQNPTSTDSFMEGWAVEFAALVSRDTGTPHPEMYPVQDSLVPLEFNYPVRPSEVKDYSWWFSEDISASSLLWDLTDDKSDLDHDHAQLDPAGLWAFLKQDNFTFSDGRHGSIRNLADLYDALNSTDRWGLKADDDSDGINNLDELFISRGIFRDLDRDGRYRAGEPVGSLLQPDGTVRRQLLLSNDTLLTIEHPMGLNPFTPFQAEVADVDVRLAAPYQNLSYHYKARLSPGKPELHLLLPPPDYLSSVLVRITSPGSKTLTRPYAINSSVYYQKLESGEGLGNYSVILMPRGLDQAPQECPIGYTLDHEYYDCVPLPPREQTIFWAGMLCLSAIVIIIVLGLVLLAWNWFIKKKDPE
ncbi:MAG: hypothetical protein V1728_01610 [Candidatus Micrarchaeota archaeon]